MAKEKSFDTPVPTQSSSERLNREDSLLTLGKGIWPLIISVFILSIYMAVSLILLIISYKFGRIK